MMDNCIFCKIAAKEIPGKVVYEDDTCIAFLDLSQTTNGHTLVIPKEHYDSFLEADPEVMAHCMKVAQKLANKIVENMHAKGYNILTNAKEVAGQTVHHFHIHIIPRYEENDPIKIEFTDRSSVVNLDDIYNEIMK